MPSKLLLIVMDGCRPDALQQANTPRIDTLWQTGAYTWNAQTVMPSVTLPSHSTMFRGVSPQKHGIREDNIYRPSAAEFPSITDVAKLGNKRTAMFYSWEQLRDLAAPGSLDLSYCKNAIYGDDNDTPVAQVAAAHLVESQPDFCFLYLGDVDINGHLHGWMSAEQIEFIEANDKAVGIVLDVLEKAGLRDAYTILLQADHGGHNTDHGTNMPEDMTIPWILNGPGVKRGHQIQAPVNMADTPATIAHILDVERPAVWEGTPVYEAFI